VATPFPGAKPVTALPRRIVTIARSPVTAAAAFLVIGIGFSSIRVGLQYDEAIFEHGAIHMLYGQGAPSFTHEQGSWLVVGRVRLPLMILPYVGAAKFYLLLLPFRLFGTAPVVSRIVSAMLGAFGIWGIGELLRRRADPALAAAAPWLLAIHPTFIVRTVFDSTGVSVWMSSVGLIALAASRYLEAPSARSAAWLGVACGFAVWCRLNFLWLLAGVAVALTIVAGNFVRRLLRIDRVSFGLGFLAGTLPLIAYEVLSGLGTIRFVASMGRASALDQLAARLDLLAQALFYDDGSLAIWSGGAVAPALRFGVASIGAAALLTSLALLRGRKEPISRWSSGAAIAFLGAAALVLASRQVVKAYHFAVYLPLVSVFVAGVAIAAARRSRCLRACMFGIAIVYVIAAATWLDRTAAGLRRTGGVGHWSDAIEDVASSLLAGGVESVDVLSWGLNNSLFVLTEGRVRGQELFWNRSEAPERWIPEVKAGGYFLVSTHTALSPAGRGFQSALRLTGARFTRQSFPQRGGRPYADVYQVGPSGSNQPSTSVTEGHLERKGRSGQVAWASASANGATSRPASSPAIRSDAAPSP
jgi:hypothetical protein